MNREEAFEFLDRTARGIAEMFGAACETLVHDMGVPGHPILSIYNGQVSGREVGSKLDVMGSSRALGREAAARDQVNMAAVTPGGRKVKSSTFHMTGEGYHLALGINFDYTDLSSLAQALESLTHAEADLQSALWRDGDNRQLESMYEECLEALGGSVPDKTWRVKLIAMLDQRGAFSFRKSVPYVAGRLGVSRYTVYKYLAEATGGAGWK